jgi:hypothetical protein
MFYLRQRAYENNLSAPARRFAVVKGSNDENSWFGDNTAQQQTSSAKKHQNIGRQGLVLVYGELASASA